MRKFIDITGRRFTKLVVQKKIGMDKYGHSIWLCRCDCGVRTKVFMSNLVSGSTTSCGCLYRYCYGESRTDLYSVWTAMKDRCINPNNQSYSNYGGRGITICQEWLEYMTFRNWALGNGYKKGLDIDREDNDGNYEPGNCRFVTRKVNNSNKRHTTYATAFGETKSLAEWVNDPRCSIKHTALDSRLRRGWDIALAISCPPQR